MSKSSSVASSCTSFVFFICEPEYGWLEGRELPGGHVYLRCEPGIVQRIVRKIVVSLIETEMLQGVVEGAERDDRVVAPLVQESGKLLRPSLVESRRAQRLQSLLEKLVNLEGLNRRWLKGFAKDVEVVLLLAIFIKYDSDLQWFVVLESICLDVDRVEILAVPLLLFQGDTVAVGRDPVLLDILIFCSLLVIKRILLSSVFNY